MSNLRVAIVGAGGNIGRTLLERLRADESLRVRGICRNELTAAPLRLAGFDVRCGDVSDARQATALVGDCDVVVNCASAAALPGTARREERAVVRGLLGVKGPRRLLHFSSVAAYGTCITERNTFERPRPDHPFGRDKLDLERFLARHAPADRQVVVLRMGHVYGAEQWVSRFVLDQLGTGWRLPYDGRFASNAVHVANAAAAVRSLLTSDQVGTFNLFDSPQSTWREVFDWNTNAIGARPVAGLDDATSDAVRDHFGRISREPARQLLREVGAWARGLPISLASSSQQVRFLAMGLLSTLQSTKLEQHVVKRFFGGHLDRRGPSPLLVGESWSVSQPAPGPCVVYARAVNADDVRAAARWHEGYASPDALAPFAPRAAGQVTAQA
ncbi:MAG: NAD(P)-dependent oxidoreductase [Myxococcales bacterium]|nr:NAD(P)-dependent oxidoreductase [Myxococcales bacterium]